MKDKPVVGARKFNKMLSDRYGAESLPLDSLFRTPYQGFPYLFCLSNGLLFFRHSNRFFGMKGLDAHHDFVGDDKQHQHDRRAHGDVAEVVGGR